MGSDNKKIEQLHSSLKIPYSLWRKTGYTQLTDYLQYIGSSTSIPHRLQAQLNIVKVNENNSQLQQLQIYHYRKQCKNSLLKCYGAELISNKNTNNMLCGFEIVFKVLSQRIIKNLMAFPQLTATEAVYVLKQALEGYQILYKKLGEFQIRNELMGLNSIGQFKVWCNINSGKNFPEHQVHLIQQQHDNKNRPKSPQQLYQCNNQSNMVTKILQLIESKCTNLSKYPRQLSKKLKITSNNRYSYDFSTIIREIQEYIKEYGIVMPSRLSRLIYNSDWDASGENSNGKIEKDSIASTGYFKQIDDIQIRNSNNSESQFNTTAANTKLPQLNSLPNNDVFFSFMKGNNRNVENSPNSNSGKSRGFDTFGLNTNSPILQQKKKYMTLEFKNKDNLTASAHNNANNTHTGNYRILQMKTQQSQTKTIENNNIYQNVNELPSKNRKSMSGIPKLKPTPIAINTQPLQNLPTTNKMQHHVNKNKQLYENEQTRNKNIFSMHNYIHTNNHVNGINAQGKTSRSTSKKLIKVCSIGKVQNKPIVTFNNNYKNVNVPNNEYGLSNKNNHRNSEQLRIQTPKVVFQVNSMKTINANPNPVNKNIVLFNQPYTRNDKLKPNAISIANVAKNNNVNMRMAEQKTSNKNIII